jgi:outer membrane immunogenic protein
MRKLHWLTVGLAGVLFSGAALAADLPTHKAPAPPPPVQPAFTWGGLYVGGFVGGNWTKVTPHDVTNPGFTGDPVLNSNGITGGGLAGYNWVFNGFLLGGEMEAGYDHRGVTEDYFTPGGFPRSATSYGRIEGRLRGRLGYAWNNFLLFVAGGATVSDLKLTYDNPLANGGLGFAQEIDRWRGGWNFGGGLEWAVTNNWILRGEYIYDGYQSPIYAFKTLDPNGFDNRSGKLQESTARAAIIYKF